MHPLAQPVKPVAESPAPRDSVAKEFDGEEFDNDFLAAIDALAEQADLAAIPVHFYTPRVPSVPGEHGASPGQCNLLIEWEIR